MSDADKSGEPDGKNTDTSDGESSKDDGKVDLSKFVSREELQQVIAQRDELKKTLREIEKTQRDKTKSEADKAKDIDALRAVFEAEVTEFKTKAENLERQLHTTILERDALSALTEVTTDPQVALMLLRDGLEISEKDGKPFIRPRNSSLTIREWAERTLQEQGKDYLLKSKRKPGTGTTGADNVNGGGEEAAVPSDFSSWPVAKQKEWMIKNPKTAAMHVNRMLGGG